MISTKNLMGSITLTAMALSLAACNTTGSTRLAGIGAGDGGGSNGSGGDGSGSGGGDGSGNSGGGSGTGSGGGSGSGGGGGSGTGGTGSGGAGSGGNGSGSSGTGGALASLPIGSITGSGGVANTGVLPNTGQAGKASPLAPVLVAAGNAALGLSDATGKLTDTGGSTGLAPVTGAVQQTLANTGNALKDGASGKTPLLDGVTKAVAPVATVALGGTTLVGDASGSSLVAVSAGSPATGNGSVVDLHLAKNSPLPAAGNLLGAQVADATLAHPTGTPAVDVQVLSPNSPEAQALGVGVLSHGEVASVTAPALNGATGKLTQVANGVLSKAGGGALPGNGALGVQVANTAVIPASGTPAIAANVLSPNAPNASALGVGVLSGGKLVSVALPGVTNGAAAGTPIANPLAAVGTILHH